MPNLLHDSLRFDQLISSSASALCARRLHAEQIRCGTMKVRPPRETHRCYSIHSGETYHDAEAHCERIEREQYFRLPISSEG